MEIQIPGLLRIKPNGLYKLGKYLRKAVIAFQGAY